MNDKCLLAIPVFNEQDHVIAVLRAVLEHARHVLVVDDGSTDATPDRLRQFEDVRVIRHASNAGYGRSLADAFKYAEKHGFEWLITMDCDGQHEPDTIPQFMAAAARDDADVISGSRYLKAFDGDDLPPADRRSINMTITNMLRQRLGLCLTDAFCGFKAYRVAALACMDITESGYAMPMQFWAQAAWLGLRIRELPVRLLYKDLQRSFGGGLDNPTVRYRHYMDVFERECRALQSGTSRVSARRACGLTKCGQSGRSSSARCASS